MRFSEMKEGVKVKIVGEYAGSPADGGCFTIGDTLTMHYDVEEKEPFVICRHGKHYLKSSLTRQKTMPEFEVVK